MSTVCNQTRDLNTAHKEEMNGRSLVGEHCVQPDQGSQHRTQGRDEWTQWSRLEEALVT